MTETSVADPISPSVAVEPASPAAVASEGTPEAKTEPTPALTPAAPVYEFKDAAPEHAAELTALATENKWTPEQASKFYARDVAREQAYQAKALQAWQATAADGEAISRADPIIGGAKYEQTRADAQRMIEKYQPAGMPSAWEGLVRMGLDRDPLVLHILHAIHAGQAEPKSLVTGGATGTAPKKSVGEIFYPDMKKKE